MVDVRNTYKSIYQNLIDAGCNSSITEQCMSLVKDGKAADMLPILAAHRESLLASVHTGQKQIDCLDFLIYTVKKNKNDNPR